MTERRTTCLCCDAPIQQPRTGRSRKYCSDKCRKQYLYGGACVECGAPTTWARAGGEAHTFCGKHTHLHPTSAARQNRLRAMPKYIEIEELWNAGVSMQGIAEALGMTKNCLGTTMVRMRKDFRYHLPYRYAVRKKRVAS